MQLDEWYLFQFIPFNVNFLNFLAIATPHQSAGSEVPSDSFPPGEAKGRLRELVLFNVLLNSGGWRVRSTGCLLEFGVAGDI